MLVFYFVVKLATFLASVRGSSCSISILLPFLRHEITWLFQEVQDQVVTTGTPQSELDAGKRTIRLFQLIQNLRKHYEFC
jgi:hypothetical protein